MKAPKSTMTAIDVRAALAGVYRQPEWAFFTEVADGTGANARRRADAIAMNMWPSRGLEIRAFEIKVARSDLLAELKNPAKAEAIARYADTFYLATPKGLVLDTDDIPAPWGLIEASNAGQIRIRKQAPEKSVRREPSREFVAALLRSAVKAEEAELEAEIQARVALAVNRLHERQEQSTAFTVQRLVADNTRDAEGVLELDAMLQDAFGMSARALLNDKNFAAAVKAVQSLGIESSWKGIFGLHGNLERVIDSASETRDLIAQQLATFRDP